MSGVCKLTGEGGKFVDSHLIPKALTSPSEKGAPLIQARPGERSARRWSSWSDKRLVTQKGEDILSALDDWAIKELRQHKLVWSGWGPMLSLGELGKCIPGTDKGIREVEISDPSRLRLFYLSILWRAAATDRPEFSEIVLSPDDLEQLRKMVLTGETEPLSFYPAQLIQLSTLERIHNYSPVAMIKTNPAVGDLGERQIPIFRFYFDGLVAHVHRQSSDDGYTQSVANLVVGAEKRLLVSTITFEESLQRERLEAAMADVARRYGSGTAAEEFPGGVTVKIDTKWPNMWRVHLPNGWVSDMANLARAKDAARLLSRSEK